MISAISGEGERQYFSLLSSIKAALEQSDLANRFYLKDWIESLRAFLRERRTKTRSSNQYLSILAFSLGSCLDLQIQVLRMKLTFNLSGKMTPVLSFPKKDFRRRKRILRTFQNGGKSRMIILSTSGMDLTIEQLGHSIIQSGCAIASLCKSGYSSFSVQSAFQRSSSRWVTGIQNSSPNCLARLDFQDQAGPVT